MSNTGVVKATVGVVDWCQWCVLYKKRDLLGFMVLSNSLDVYDLIFLLFPTFLNYWQVALAEMLTTRDLAIFYDDNDRTDYYIFAHVHRVINVAYSNR